MIESQYDVTEEPVQMVRSRIQDVKEDMRHRYEDMKVTVQHNPGSSLLATLGTGLAIGLFLGMALAGSRRRNHSLHLLDDLESRFRGFTRTPLRRAGDLRGRIASIFS
jgi:hypothetical protein